MVTAAAAPSAASTAALGAEFPRLFACAERVHPRPFHAGPTPPAADSDASAAESADGPPPTARLHLDALESIFALLSQRDLAVALQVSRGWLSAVRSMASLELEVGRPAAPLFVVAASAMGRHISALGSFCDGDSDDAPSGVMDGDARFSLAHLMPRLRSLACVLPLPPWPVPLRFPAALRRLDVDLRVSAAVTAAHVNTALRAIGRLPLLESLTILLPALDPQVSFVPLAALSRLRVLDIHSEDAETKLSDAQENELRALPQLQALLLPLMTIDSLRRLLRQPHTLQWQQISFPNPVDDEFAALLPQLPSFTNLHAIASCTHFEWLRGMANLRHVSLWMDSADCGSSLAAGLECCSNIEILSLEECPDLTSAHLTDLLPRLPRLRSLELSHLSIDSLSFVAEPPLTDRLSSLCLENCAQLPLVELRHVHALRGLKTLRLHCSFTARMDDYSQSLYEPPSLLLPQLELFEYIAC